MLSPFLSQCWIPGAEHSGPCLLTCLVILSMTMWGQVQHLFSWRATRKEVRLGLAWMHSSAPAVLYRKGFKIPEKLHEK